MESRNFAKGALLGIVAGAIGGILFAPKSGKETRKELGENFNEIKDKVMTKLQEASEFTRETYDQAVNSVINTYKEAKKITPDETSEIKAIFDDSFSKIEKIIKKDAEKLKKAAKERKN